MASLNSVTLIGRVVAPPELRYTPGGKAVASFTIAVDRRMSKGQENKETDFVPIVAWERLGEICNEYLTKGKLICIQGSLRTRTYEKDGEKRKAFEINANEMQMLSGGEGGPGGGGGRPSGERSYSSAPPRQAVGAGAQGGGHQGGAGNWGNDVGFSDDVGMDDIPF
ncbi:unnamed protein product [Phaeothamnion confervicola]